MKEIHPPRFLILTVLAFFLFAFAAGALFFWPQAREGKAEAIANEEVTKK